jgi:replication initiation protein RepC
VLSACPEITPWARGGVDSWRSLEEAAALARPALGISPDAWRAAQDALGGLDAAITVAAILQKGPAIRSPGGYLRSLTEKAALGQFSLGPVIMALLAARNRPEGAQAGRAVAKGRGG